MTATSLLKRAKALHRTITPGPKTWLAVLEPGAIPEEIQAMLAPGDTIIIRQVPPGYFPDFVPVAHEVIKR